MNVQFPTGHKLQLLEQLLQVVAVPHAVSVCIHLHLCCLPANDKRKLQQLPVCQVRRSDVMSAWSGIRPLASDPDAQDTASASRDHVVSMDADGMITIAGDLLLIDLAVWAVLPASLPF